MWGNNLHREGTRIQWFKLLLDEDERRRHEAQFMFSQLENLGLTISDAITDYLTFLLTHTKSELRIHNRYCDDCTIQLVLTVPNVWSARASSTMVHSMESAAKDLSFGHRSEVFLVSEADAAATYFCEKIPDLVLHLGDVFMVADIGGGTLDLMVYKVLHMYPFRFDLVVPGTGAVCGSSHLNRAFVRDLKAKIENDPRYGNIEAHLPMSWTIDDILRTANYEFETIKKDIGSKQAVEYIRVPFLPKLQADPYPAPNSFYADREFLANIFLPHLNQILDLIRSQMQAAASVGEPCSHIVLIGGFSLSNYLLDFLKSKIQQDCLVIREHTSQDAISRGGCLRYLNQVSGPDEIMQASYGFPRQERCNPMEFEGHKTKNAVEEYDADDGELYAHDCISYLVRRVGRVPKNTWETVLTSFRDTVPAQGRTFPEQVFILERTFRSLKQDVEIRLELFENRSEDVLEDHFHYKHEKNRGSFSQGEIEFVIPARDLKRLSVQRRGWNRRDKKCYYRLQYEARIKILGKNIRPFHGYADKRSRRTACIACNIRYKLFRGIDFLAQVHRSWTAWSGYDRIVVFTEGARDQIRTEMRRRNFTVGRHF